MTAIENLIIECHDMATALNSTYNFWLGREKGLWVAAVFSGPAFKVTNDDLETALREVQRQMKVKLIEKFDKDLQDAIAKEQAALKQANILTEEAEKIRIQKQKYINP